MGSDTIRSILDLNEYFVKKNSLGILLAGALTSY